MLSQKFSQTHITYQIVYLIILHLTFFHSHFTLNLMKLISFFLVKLRIQKGIFFQVFFENWFFMV